jgi:hypothetical protein
LWATSELAWQRERLILLAGVVEAILVGVEGGELIVVVSALEERMLYN